MSVTKFKLPAVAAAIFNSKSEILLQMRKDINKWCVLAGAISLNYSNKETQELKFFSQDGIPTTFH
jgi:hypothetical protein